MNLPHSLEAERTLLSCIVLDGPTYLIKALDYRVQPDWFFHSPHRKIWTSIMGCHAHGRPFDSHILYEEIKKAGALDAVGGLQGFSEATGYLEHGPTGVTFSYSLDQLRDNYQLRQLALVAEETREAALLKRANMDDFVAKISRILALKNATQVSKSIAQAATDCIGKLADILAGKQTEENSGMEWPWSDWNSDMGHATAGELIVIAARPGRGKSSCARQVAWHWANKYGTTILFSREMPIEQLAPLFAQIDSGVSWRAVRKNLAVASDNKKFENGLMKLSQNKNLLAFDQDRTLSQITARIEAIKAFNPPKAIIVDYLQRYDPQQEKGETRDMAIGRMTMALKDLAVSLKIPVILLAQLGREVEKENRIPRLSDLRECISVKDSLIFTSQGVWYNSTSPMSTISLNREGNIESCDSRNAKREDAPEMLKITLQSGRFITCTPNHAIRTDRGWLKASQIIDESIACVRKIPAPRNSENFSFAKWIGWMLGNGCMTGLGGPSFICSCEDVAKSFCETNKSLWGFEPKPHRHWCKSVYQYDINNSTVRTPEGNPVKNWLKQHDLWGYKAHEKTIPQWFCETADNDSLANLVAGLWETDGSVILKPRPQLSYSTTSPMLAWQVVWALNRLGVFANFEDGYMAEKANYLCYKVSVRTKEEIANFKRVIRLIGRKGKRLDSITASDPSNTAGSRLSKTVGKAIEAFRLQQGFTHKQMGYRYQGKRISQRDLQRVNENIRKLGYRCAKFDELTNADIFWDKIRRIEKVAGGPVFDRVVPEHHNFVANGIVVHNSGNIEQDADRVIFIHAPDENQDGSKQDLTDQTLQRIEVQIVQAKGRSDGVASIGMSFHRPTTTFWGMSR